MKQHIDTVHKGLKKYQCHICKKDLSLRSSLLKHIRAVHEKQKPYKCESCDSSFAQGAHLRAHVTGKSFSEALILGSTNLQYDRRLFIDLRVQYMKIPSSEHGENKGRTCKQHVLNMFSSCSPHVLSLEFSCIELLNL